MLSKFFLTINKTFDKRFKNFVKIIFTLNKKKNLACDMILFN